MLNKFYYWDDHSEHRKLWFIYSEKDIEIYIKESEKFISWDKDFRICNKCNENLPHSEYFFKLKGSRGLDKACKKCTGYKYAWGKKRKYELIEDGHKYCQSCDTVYPLNLIFFNKNKHSKADGASSYCKKCVSGSNFSINRHLNELVDDLKEDHKVCLSCLYELPNSKEYYFSTSNSKDGLEFNCKVCNGVEYGVVYINKVYDKIIPSDCKMCARCKETKDKKYFSKNKRISDGHHCYCNNCMEVISILRRQGDNSDYSYEDWNYSRDYWRNEKHDIECAYCGKVEHNPSREHVVPFSKGGDLTRYNIIPVCRSCNSSKRDRYLIDYYFSDSNRLDVERFNKVLSYLVEGKIFKEGKIVWNTHYIEDIDEHIYVASIV